MATKHGILVNDILREYGGDPRWRIWPNNTGTAFRGRRKISFGKIFSADIIGFLDNGKFVNIEVKVGRDKQSEGQRDYEAVVNQYQAVYLVARSIEDVAKFLSSYSKAL